MKQNQITRLRPILRFAALYTRAFPPVISRPDNQVLEKLKLPKPSRARASICLNREMSCRQSGSSAVCRKISEYRHDKTKTTQSQPATKESHTSSNTSGIERHTQSMAAMIRPIKENHRRTGKFYPIRQSLPRRVIRRRVLLR